MTSVSSDIAKRITTASRCGSFRNSSFIKSFFTESDLIPLNKIRLQSIWILCWRLLLFFWGDKCCFFLLIDEKKISLKYKDTFLEYIETRIVISVTLLIFKPNHKYAMTNMHWERVIFDGNHRCCYEAMII